MARGATAGHHRATALRPRPPLLEPAHNRRKSTTTCALPGPKNTRDGALGDRHGRPAEELQCKPHPECALMNERAPADRPLRRQARPIRPRCWPIRPQIWSGPGPDLAKQVGQSWAKVSCAHLGGNLGPELGPRERGWPKSAPPSQPAPQSTRPRPRAPPRRWPSSAAPRARGRRASNAAAAAASTPRPRRRRRGGGGRRPPRRGPTRGAPPPGLGPSRGSSPKVHSRTSPSRGSGSPTRPHHQSLDSTSNRPQVDLKSASNRPGIDLRPTPRNAPESKQSKGAQPREGCGRRGGGAEEGSRASGLWGGKPPAAPPIPGSQGPVGSAEQAMSDSAARPGEPVLAPRIAPHACVWKGAWSCTWSPPSAGRCWPAINDGGAGLSTACQGCARPAGARPPIFGARGKCVHQHGGARVEQENVEKGEKSARSSTEDGRSEGKRSHAAGCSWSSSPSREPGSTRSMVRNVNQFLPKASTKAASDPRGGIPLRRRYQSLPRATMRNEVFDKNGHGRRFATRADDGGGHHRTGEATRSSAWKSD